MIPGQILWEVLHISVDKPPLRSSHVNIIPFRAYLLLIILFNTYIVRQGFIFHVILCLAQNECWTFKPIMLFIYHNLTADVIKCTIPDEIKYISDIFIFFCFFFIRFNKHVMHLNWWGQCFKSAFQIVKYFKYSTM